jgi:hypothetical protein
MNRFQFLKAKIEIKALARRIRKASKYFQMLRAREDINAINNELLCKIKFTNGEPDESESRFVDQEIKKLRRIWNEKYALM